MDEPALKRSPRNQSFENDSEDGEPERKKPALESTSKKSESETGVSILDFQRDSQYPGADGESKTCEDTCAIESLPLEILDIIFKYVAERQRMNLRLVCKVWRDRLNQGVKIYFNAAVPHIHLENCGFKRLNIEFRNVNIKELPPSTWEKIGPEIHSIVLKSCKLGDLGLKNLLVYCHNLRSLRVVLNNNDDDANMFCSPNMLRELNDIVQKNLETFEIISTQKTVDVAKWIQVFEALFKIFPNVTHYSSGCRDSPEAKATFQFGFSRELGENDLNGISSSLAFSLSKDESHHRQALEASSTLRLNIVSLHFMKSCYKDEDESTLINLFTNHKNLKYVMIMLNKSVSSEMLKTVLFQVLEHCSNLCKLEFCKNMPQDWLHTLSKTEFAQLSTKCSSLEELSINHLRFLIKSSSLSSKDDCRFGNMEYISSYEQCVMGFVTNYPDLQHLDVECYPFSDGMLQCIFKHLVNLKTLSIRVSHKNTNVGITGRHDYVPGVCKRRVDFYRQIMARQFHSPSGTSGMSCDFNSMRSTSSYSINRLRDLEKLILIGYSFSQMTDIIFYEFDFPKLRYLLFDPPDDPTKLLPIMGEKMPSLETIYFMSQIPDYEVPEDFENLPEKSLVTFCRHTKKLREIILPKTDFGSGMLENDIVDVFKVCPSLHSIEGYYLDKACYDPITQTVVITGKCNGTYAI